MFTKISKVTVLGSSGLMIIGGVLLAPDVQSQASRTIGNAPSCPSCRIETVSSVLLRGEPEGEELAQPPYNVVSGHGGLIYVLREGGALAYRDNGAFVRSLARAGSGPGEIRSPTDLWRLPGDSLLLFDGANQRAMLYDRTGKAGRHIAFPHRFRNGVVLRWPDSVVMSGPVGTPTGAGWPLHLLSFRTNTATVKGALAAGDGQLQRGRELSMQHPLAMSKDGAWLSIKAASYELTKWNRRLEAVDRFVRSPDWLSSESNLGTGTPNTPPSPRIRHLREDGSGLVWVFSWVAGPTWREAWTGVNGGGGREGATSRIRTDKLYVTRVDVLELTTGSLLASATLQGTVFGVLDDDRVALFQFGLPGVPVLRVAKLRLVGNR